MRQGFTLAELLIALAILGVIATFTIPKVLQSQQDGKWNAIAKENMATVYAAYHAHRTNGLLSASTKMTDLTPYINYVKLISNSSLTVDNAHELGTAACNNTLHCMVMHNGSTIQFDVQSFGGSGTTNALTFMTDPDGKVTDGTTNGPGKGAFFFIYYDGRMTDRGNSLPNTQQGASNYASPAPTKVPPWFSWN